jgi:hypothetical protein
VPYCVLRVKCGSNSLRGASLFARLHTFESVGFLRPDEILASSLRTKPPFIG